VRFAVAVALQHRDGQKGLHDPPESTTPVPMRDSQLAKKGLSISSVMVRVALV
jgi:hypothetical protein